MNWLMIGMTTLICGYVIWGWYRGMIKMLMAVGSLFLSLAVSLVIAPYVQELVCDYTSIDERVVQNCVEVIERKLEDVETTQLSEFSKIIDKMMGQSNVLETMTESAKVEIAKTIAHSILKWGIFIVTALTLWIVFHIVMGALDLVSKLPLINELNKLIGAALGLVQGIIAVWLLLTIVDIFPQVEFFAWCNQMIAQSEMLSALQKWNLISIVLFR